MAFQISDQKLITEYGIFRVVTGKVSFNGGEPKDLYWVEKGENASSMVSEFGSREYACIRASMLDSADSNNDAIPKDLDKDGLEIVEAQGIYTIVSAVVNGKKTYWVMHGFNVRTEGMDLESARGYIQNELKRKKFNKPT